MDERDKRDKRKGVSVRLFSDTPGKSPRLNCFFFLDLMRQSGEQ